MPLNRKHIEEGVRREIKQNREFMKRELSSDEKQAIRKHHEEIAKMVDKKNN